MEIINFENSSRDLTHHNNESKTAEAFITELKQGREFAVQLRRQLLHPSSSINGDVSPRIDYLFDKIFSSYRKLQSMICVTTTPNHDGGSRLNELVKNEKKPETAKSPPPPQSPSCGIRRGRPAGSSVGDGGSDMVGSPSKKRKQMLSSRSEYVKLSPTEAAAVLDGGGALGDGYSWRKYGQKKIHGTIHPRNYYRCTHRDTQNCLAKKQVQISDDDPTLVHVIYTENHTCHHRHRARTTTTVAVAAATTNMNTLQHSNHTTPDTNNDLVVEVEPLNGVNPTNIVDLESFFRSLSFSLSFKSLLAEPLNGVMPTIADLYSVSPIGSDPNSSTTPGSLSTNNNLNFGTSESDFNEALSTGPNSVTNSPIGEYDFWSLDDFNFDVPHDHEEDIQLH